MISKTIKISLVKAVHVGIDFIKYFAVLAAVLVLLAALFGAGLIGKFIAPILTLASLFIVGSYGRSVLF